MKKYLIQFLVILVLASCNKRSNGIKLAKEVCDCFENIRERKVDCAELAAEAEKKLMNNPKESTAFTETMSECTHRLINLPK